MSGKGTWVGADGSPIDESDARRMAKEFEIDDAALVDAQITVSRRVGRPSLTASGGPSPQVTFRLSPSMRDRAERVAHARGTTVSALARQALEELVNRAS